MSPLLLLTALGGCDLRARHGTTVATVDHVVTSTADADADTDSDSDSDTDADVDSDTDADTDTAATDEPCPDDWLAGAPDSVSGDTTALSADHEGSCGGAGSPDAVIGFTAPADGDYTFDTVGSAFDTVLYALDGCDGAELACDDDGAGDRASELTLTLLAGESVHLVVDGWNGAGGAFSLQVSAPMLPCADFALPDTVPAQVAEDTTGASNQGASSCGGASSPDHAWSFVAPASGTYVFDTFGSSFDTVLYVLDRCNAIELGCNDDDSLFVLQSEVRVSLSAGQQVLVVVDGYDGDSGPYTLSAW